MRGLVSSKNLPAAQALTPVIATVSVLELIRKTAPLKLFDRWTPWKAENRYALNVNSKLVANISAPVTRCVVVKKTRTPGSGRAST